MGKPNVSVCDWTPAWPCLLGEIRFVVTPGRVCQPEDSDCTPVRNFSAERHTSRSQVEDTLRAADNAKARMSIWISTFICHRAPPECARELAPASQCSSPTVASLSSLGTLWPFAGLELAGLGHSQHRPAVTGTLLAPSFEAPRPGTRPSLWTHSLLESISIWSSIISFTCVLYCFDCLFL